MRKRALIITHSYFMLLTAIQIKLTILKDYDVDIIISDYSNNSDQICKNLEKCGIFSKTVYAPVKAIYQGGKLGKKILKTLRVFESSEKVAKRFKLDNLNYDELFFSNFDIISTQLFYGCLKENKDLICNRFEEGYSTYTVANDYTILEKIMKVVSKIDKRPLLVDQTKRLYLFDPELYVQSKEYDLIEIESLSRNNYVLKEIINKTFGYQTNKVDYDCKYIIFEESFLIANENVKDFELFTEIINELGSENVIIKLHPRNPVDRFSDLGYRVSEVVDVPWEIIQFNNDFSDKVLITISSGSTINSKSFFNDQIDTLVLFNCLETTPRLITDEFKLYLNKITQKYGNNGFKIPKNKSELLENLAARN